jgi:hypothetical protein
MALSHRVTEPSAPASRGWRRLVQLSLAEIDDSRAAQELRRRSASVHGIE